MGDIDRIREGLIASIGSRRSPRAVADALCGACVTLLDVDGAVLTLVDDGAVSSALGSSGELSSRLIEMQFTLGEGPCLEVAGSATAMAIDLGSPHAQRWPAFAREASLLGVRAMFVLPVAVVGSPIGTLCLHRNRAEPFVGAVNEGCFLAAELAGMPLLDLIAIDLHAAAADDTSSAWKEIASLSRSEVYQAVGVLMVQLEMTPAEALVRLRGYAFAHGMTTSELAYDILEHRRDLRQDGSEGPPQRERDN